MGKRKQLTDFQRNSIIYGHKIGHSSRQIAKIVGCGHSAVSACINRYNVTGSTEAKPRSERPCLLQSSDRKNLKRLVTNKKNCRKCARDIQDLWKKKNGQEISVSTIQHALNSVGLKNCAARCKPFISPDNMNKQLMWAREHAHWTTEDWAKVLWSDESTFTQFQQAQTSWVWCETSEEWSPDCVSVTVKHSPSRMFWGCFSAHGLGPIVYWEIIQKQVLPTMKCFFPHGDGWFQDYNAPPH